ncbi:MAG: phage tail assembly protein [Desulfovibrionaceae bacterium]
MEKLKRIPLLMPVEIAEGEKIAELVMQLPMARHVLAARREAGDAADFDPTLFALLCNVPRALIADLCAADLHALDAAYAEMTSPAWFAGGGEGNA